MSDRQCQKADINSREMWVVMTAANRWCSRWQDKNVEFITDNLTVYAALDTGRCKSKLILAWVCELFWLLCHWNFSIQSAYIPSRYNTICDALSRWSECSSKSRIASAVVY